MITAPQELHQDLEKNKIESGSELISSRKKSDIAQILQKTCKYDPQVNK
jgi:hypothetical protein